MNDRGELFHVPVVRRTGELDGSPGLTLTAKAGQLNLRQGVICARRHIHMGPNEAAGMS